jgi:hypothetical protein
MYGRRILLQRKKLEPYNPPELERDAIMSTEAKKVETPAYPSYVTFNNFIKGLRDTGIPSRIDKSVLGKLSGSAQAALVPGLKWLDLIDAAGTPTAKLEALVHADEASYPKELRKVLEASYSFITDGSITLSKATGSQVEGKFREYGISGSTVIKCMAFFILAAKDARIELGPHVKAPKAAASSNGAKRKSRKAPLTGSDEPDEEEEEEKGDGIPDLMPGFIKIPIPLHGMEDGAVFLPDNMTSSQWSYALKITKFLIENYRMEDAPPKSAEGTP